LKALANKVFTLAVGRLLYLAVLCSLKIEKYKVYDVFGAATIYDANSNEI